MAIENTEDLLTISKRLARYLYKWNSETTRTTQIAHQILYEQTTEFRGEEAYRLCKARSLFTQAQSVCGENLFSEHPSPK